MKIGIYFESIPDHGGVYHETINLMTIFKEFNNSDHDFIYIVSDKDIESDLKNYNCKTVFFKKNYLFRIYQFFFKFLFFKIFLKKIGLINNFESFVKSKKIDILLFNGPSELSVLCNNLAYVIVLYELQHLTNNYLPEYKDGHHHDFDLREIVLKNFLKRAFKTIVATKKDKELVKNFYNTNDKNLVVNTFIPYLPGYYEKHIDLIDDKKELNFLGIEKKKNFLFYPSQFIPHKNHKYIVDGVEYAIKQGNENIHVVFCGNDKSNLKYLKRIIKEKKIDKNFTIFNYISNEQIISLYKNAFALIMPTFVGHFSLPLYESFYFNLPVIYTEDQLDNELRKFVFEVNTLDPKSMIEKIIYIKNNPSEVAEMTENAKKFYTENCSREKKMKVYSNIFSEYSYLRQMWDK